MTTEILYKQQTEDADAADDDDKRWTMQRHGQTAAENKRNETFEYLYEVLKLLINIYTHTINI